MFTGIIEEIGQVVSYEEKSDLTLWDGSIGKGFVLVILCKICFEDIYIGASISVNGVCLTVTSYNTTTNHIEFGISPETILCTNFSELKSGDPVNLERAAKGDSRNSGHYVQGHVDCTGKIIKKEKVEDSLYINVKIDQNNLSIDTFQRLVSGIVQKGYIAVDGTSLTVCKTESTSSTEFIFEFMLVQYTQNHVIIPKKQIGATVNIEVDVMGKYLANSVGSVSTQIHSLFQRIEILENTVSSLKQKLSKL